MFELHLIVQLVLKACMAVCFAVNVNVCDLLTLTLLSADYRMV